MLNKHDAIIDTQKEKRYKREMEKGKEMEEKKRNTCTVGESHHCLSTGKEGRK